MCLNHYDSPVWMGIPDCINTTVPDIPSLDAQACGLGIWPMFARWTNRWMDELHRNGGKLSISMGTLYLCSQMSQDRNIFNSPTRVGIGRISGEFESLCQWDFGCCEPRPQFWWPIQWFQGNAKRGFNDSQSLMADDLRNPLHSKPVNHGEPATARFGNQRLGAYQDAMVAELVPWKLATRRGPKDSKE